MLTRLFIPLLCLIGLFPAHAGLVIQGSRIIYHEAQGEASVHMQYVGDTPTLLQAWIESGAESKAPGEDEVPFILTPAVARLDPGNGQTIRIMRIQGGLPRDRESVFYFNTLEVPPTPTAQIAAGEPFMQLSIRGRFKLFYRPVGLPVGSEKSIEMLEFSLAGRDAEGRVQVRVQNASPYHVTFSTLALHPPGAAEEAEALAGFNHDNPAERMVPPFGELLLSMEWGALSAGARLPAEVEIEFAIINDAGGRQLRRQKVG